MIRKTLNTPKILENMKSLLNKRVLISGDHPCSGELGITKSIIQSPDGKRLAFMVKLDQGGECAVSDPYKILFFKNQEAQVVQ
jgi:hypothetical protein